MLAHIEKCPICFEKYQKVLKHTQQISQLIPYQYPTQDLRDDFSQDLAEVTRPFYGSIQRKLVRKQREELRKVMKDKVYDFVKRPFFVICLLALTGSAFAMFL